MPEPVGPGQPARVDYDYARGGVLHMFLFPAPLASHCTTFNRRQPDDRILVVGSGKKNTLNMDAMIVLLNKDGVPVTSFGEKGVLLSDLGGPSDAWYGIAISPDKKYVYIAGCKGTEGSGNDDAVIARVRL